MIYLGGPWVWDASGETGPSYSAPAGTIAVVDLRTIPQQSVANHANGQGNGFFAAPDGTPIPEGYEILATGDLRESVIGQPVRSAWQSIYGVTIPGDADHLIDCLSLTLGDMSDPTGDTGPKPLVPGVSPQGECCIHLAGHSVVYRRKLTVQTGGSQHARRLRDLLRRDLEAIADNDPDPDLWRRVLGYQKKKYGQAWDDDTEDWILTTKLRGKGKGRNGRTYADEPKTSYTESWPSNGAITSGQDRTWEFLTGGEPAYLDVSSNQLRHTGAGAAWTMARMTSALSGADHYAEIEYRSRTNNYDALSGIARKDATNATLTYYLTHWYGEASPTAQSYKRVSGTYTFLTSSSSGSLTSGDKVKTEINGSTLKGYVAGVEKTSVTDTAITGNTYAGVALLAQSGQQIYTDNWVGADIGGGGASRPDLGLLLGVS